MNTPVIDYTTKKLDDRQLQKIIRLEVDQYNKVKKEASRIKVKESAAQNRARYFVKYLKDVQKKSLSFIADSFDRSTSWVKFMYYGTYKQKGGAKSE